MIKLAIADDHFLIRKGLVEIVAGFKNIELLFEVENGKQLLAYIETQKPDVVLMDIKMPEIDGIEATKILKNKYPGIKVIMLSMYEDDNLVIHSIENGAVGYLVKNAEPEEVEEAINTACEQGFYFNEKVSAALLKKVLNKSNLDVNIDETDLTETEKNVLILICQEYTNQEIADKLFLSKRTVDWHRQNLLSKTKAKNTAGLVMYAVKYGLV